MRLSSELIVEKLSCVCGLMITGLSRFDLRSGWCYNFFIQKKTGLEEQDDVEMAVFTYYTTYVRVGIPSIEFKRHVPLGKVTGRLCQIKGLARLPVLPFSKVFGLSCNGRQADGTGSNANRSSTRVDRASATGPTPQLDTQVCAVGGTTISDDQLQQSHYSGVHRASPAVQERYQF